VNLDLTDEETRAPLNLLVENDRGRPGGGGVATGRQLGNIEHFRLWESPCGLAFFDPMLVGDEDFYRVPLLNRGSPISAE
jgi:hypothetical protein